jgi:thiol:disulfide interchange protein
MPLNPRHLPCSTAKSRRLLAILLTIPLLLTAAAGASFISARPPAEVVTLRTVWSADGAHPGGGAVLAVVLDIAEGYHINADAAQLVVPEGFSPLPTRVEVTSAAATLSFEAPHFPPAHALKLDFSDVPLMFFDGQVVVFLPVTVSPRAEPGDHPLELLVAYQACDTQTCLLPRTIPVSAVLPLRSAGSPLTPLAADLFAAFYDARARTQPQAVRFELFGVAFSIDVSAWLGRAVLLITAAFGGALLNFTPCVLPLIPIKVMALANLAGNRRRCLILGLAMGAGVVAFWLLLGALIATVSGFSAANQLFQYPAFTIGVGLFIALMAVGMGGFFHLRLPGFVYRFNPAPETLPGSFGLGILAAVLSTPCTAPFMGAAAAWAATQPPPTTLTTFAAIGGGMALPYLVLAAAPGLVRKMPRTGPASDLIKEVMALLMLAAAAYFIGSGLSSLLTTPPEPPGRGYWWAVMGFSALAGAWLLLRTLRISRAARPRALFGTLGVVVVLLAVLGGFRLTRSGAIDWLAYTPEAFSAARQNSQTVVMVFTAEWCLNCKALEQGVLNRSDVARRLSAEDIAPIRVDISGANPAGKARLKATGSLTIPLLIVYGPDGREFWRSDFYTAQQLLEALDGAQKRGRK